MDKVVAYSRDYISAIKKILEEESVKFLGSNSLDEYIELFDKIGADDPIFLVMDGTKEDETDTYGLIGEILKQIRTSGDYPVITCFKNKNNEKELLRNLGSTDRVISTVFPNKITENYLRQEILGPAFLDESIDQGISNETKREINRSRRIKESEDDDTESTLEYIASVFENRRIESTEEDLEVFKESGEVASEDKLKDLISQIEDKNEDGSYSDILYVLNNIDDIEKSVKRLDSINAILKESKETIKSSKESVEANVMTLKNKKMELDKDEIQNLIEESHIKETEYKNFKDKVKITLSTYVEKLNKITSPEYRKSKKKLATYMDKTSNKGALIVLNDYLSEAGREYNNSTAQAISVYKDLSSYLTESMISMDSYHSYIKGLDNEIIGKQQDQINKLENSKSIIVEARDSLEGKLIPVFGPDGVGKTFAALMIAHNLKYEGAESVAIVDLDLDSPTLIDYINRINSFKEFISGSTVSDVDNFTYVGYQDDFSVLSEFDRIEEAGTYIGDNLNKIYDEYDYIIVIMNELLSDYELKLSEIAMKGALIMDLNPKNKRKMTDLYSKIMSKELFDYLTIVINKSPSKKLNTEEVFNLFGLGVGERCRTIPIIPSLDLIKLKGESVFDELKYLREGVSL